MNYQAIFLCVIAVLTGCSTTTHLGHGHDRKQMLFVSEQSVVKKANKDFKKQFGQPHKEYYTTQEAHFASLMNRMIPYADEYLASDREINWGIQIYTSNHTNAGALANGVILLSNKMVNNPKISEDAIAYVIAHEMAHVIRQHHREHRSWKYAVSPVLLGSALLTGGASAWISGAFNDGYGGLYQRNLEAEADLLGLEIISKAGFDTKKAMELFDVMQQVYIEEYPTLSKLPDIFKAHPSIPKRKELSESFLNTTVIDYQHSRLDHQNLHSERLIDIQYDPRMKVLIEGKLKSISELSPSEISQHLKQVPTIHQQTPTPQS